MAVVTGAASGMGLAVAERFLAEGRIVVGVDRDAEALAKAAASCGPAYHPVTADITDRTALSAASGPSIARPGSPGITWQAKKMMMLSSQSVTRASPRRLRM